MYFFFNFYSRTSSVVDLSNSFSISFLIPSSITPQPSKHTNLSSHFLLSHSLLPTQLLKTVYINPQQQNNYLSGTRARAAKEKLKHKWEEMDHTIKSITTETSAHLLLLLQTHLPQPQPQLFYHYYVEFHWKMLRKLHHVTKKMSPLHRKWAAWAKSNVTITTTRSTLLHILPEKFDTRSSRKYSLAETYLLQQIVTLVHVLGRVNPSPTSRK